MLEATNTIRDALTSRTEPVYGLTTIHGSLRAFQAEPPQAATSADTKASTVAFGLIALGQFILRLPAEILEDELPRLKGTLISVRPPSLRPSVRACLTMRSVGTGHDGVARRAGVRGGGDRRGAARAPR